jgi:hypothetical protein
MDMSKVHSIAKRLVEAHGVKAELQVAQKLKEAESEGNDQKIELWRRVRSATQEMKPAHES